MLICDTLINYYLLTVMIREYFGQMQSNNSYRGYKQNNFVKGRLEMKERTVLQMKKKKKKREQEITYCFLFASRWQQIWLPFFYELVLQ